MDSVELPVDVQVPASQVELHKLSRDVYMAYGDRTRANAEDPRIVILFGWMDAPIRLTTKYAMNHRRRWPSSDIAIVQSHPSFIWTSEEGRDEILRPLADYLVSTVYRDSKGACSGILLHVISNGGAFQMITLSRVLHSIISSSSNIPRRSIRLATIIDSAPGTGEYSSLLATLTANVKSPAVKTLTNVPVALFYLVVRLRRAALREENLFTDLHARLQRPDLLPLSDSLAPRLYIYSTSDAMVPFTSVEKHISVLQQSTPPFDVSVKKFTTSPHVLHERDNSARYWTAVRAVWQRSAPVRVKL
ncbi:hypothetical protein FB451DRAFT_1550534 [Mycena latifolia]|nr:hypothetical protein FB451DRAFT_1550534 [Mycena latifolia]